LFSQHHTSCTWYEYPVIADTDGDLRSEIVIPSNSNCAVTCPAVDPIHDGVRCGVDADCPGTTLCRREAPSDPFGRCRCSSDLECGSPSMRCLDGIRGTSAQGKVCRAIHPVGVPERGIQVLHDAQDRWVSSRMIWNQHAYAVTHVDESGHIPKTSHWEANWLDPKLNNFRMNVQGAMNPLDAPDMTGPKAAYDCDDSGTALLKAKVCNRGTAPVASGVPVTFYKESQAPANVLCTVPTTRFLSSGDCEVLTCPWPNAVHTPTDVILSADDDGTGKSASIECEENNNVAKLTNVYCLWIN
jgi:hypothetical protein